jgi:hypothetical protein
MSRVGARLAAFFLHMAASVACGNVLAWLLPLGLCRLKHLPREWVMSSFITALGAMGFTAYHNSARDAGPALARPIFSIAGPLLSVSVALLIVDLAERWSALDKKRTIG